MLNFKLLFLKFPYLLFKDYNKPANLRQSSQENVATK